MNHEVNEHKTWSLLRKSINQQYTYDEDWKNALHLFHTRITRKYFTPIELILKGRALEGEGFTIVTVQCTLIEMFAAFRTGKIFSYDNPGNPLYYYRESQQMFTSFLRSNSIFENNFWRLNNRGKVSIDFPFNANEFYYNVRCALIHEARTKNNWIINATNKDVKKETVFLEESNGKIKIYRTILHHRLKSYLSTYIEELREQANTDLRRNFARKLDDLFDYKPDANYEWWI